jgi:hypothetical protein
MIRKLVLALGATAIIGATALAPTSASAFGKGKFGHGPHLGIVVASPTYVADDYCYVTEQTYLTKHGHYRVRYVQVCD